MTNKVVLFETELTELKKLSSIIKEQTTDVAPGINTAAGQEAERARQAARFADFRQRNPNLSSAAELAVGAAVPGTAVAKGGTKLFNWLRGGDAAKKAASAASRTEPRIDLTPKQQPAQNVPGPTTTPTTASKTDASGKLPSQSPPISTADTIAGPAAGGKQYIPVSPQQSIPKSVSSGADASKMTTGQAIATGLGTGAAALGAASLIDTPQSKQTPQAPASQPTPQSTQSAVPSYTVKAGDTLGHIAQQYKTTVADIIKNQPDLVDTDSGKLKSIKPGQTINVGQSLDKDSNIWKGYDVEKLGTGSGKEFKESVQELKKLSGMVK